MWRRPVRGSPNAQACLKNGVTTVRDVGCPDDVAIHLSHAIRRGIVKACDIVPCGRALQITGGHVPEVENPIADTSDEILKAIRYLKSIGAKWIKIMATGGAYGPEEIGPVLYSEEEMRPDRPGIASLAHESGVYPPRSASSTASKPGLIRSSMVRSSRRVFEKNEEKSGVYSRHEAFIKTCPLVMASFPTI